MIDIIYKEAVNNKTQYHTEQIGRLKELNNRKPEWSEPKKLARKMFSCKRIQMDLLQSKLPGWTF